MLQELASRRNLRVLYIRLDSRTSTGIVTVKPIVLKKNADHLYSKYYPVNFLAGLIQVMLQISTSPVVVVSGQGRTILEAKAEAALNALECIRITAKKMPFQTMNLSL